MDNGYYKNRIPHMSSVGERRRRSRAKGGLFFVLAAVCAVAIIAMLLTIIVNVFGGDEEVQVGSAEGTYVQKTYNIPPASEENDLLKIAKEAKGTDKKICYLTFDDGPTNEVTPAVLDVLKQYNVKATFFALGKMLDANRDIARREYEEGHLIANHSYFHDYDELYASSESFMNEINKTNDLIKEITGEDTFKLIRFPGGGYNAGDHAAEKQVYKKVLKENGYYYADWNCLNGDAETGLRSVDELVAKVKNTAIEKNIVVLMHDAATKKTTPQALGRIIEYLKSQGYEFRRLDEIEYYDDGQAEVVEGSMIL